jgi:hypothetical protein
MAVKGNGHVAVNLKELTSRKKNGKRAMDDFYFHEALIPS